MSNADDPEPVTRRLPAGCRLGLLRRRRARKRALGTRRPMLLPDAANERWSLDFVSDALADGRWFWALCVVDDFTREAPAVVVDTSLSGQRVARELDRIIVRRDTPQMIVSDNGTELTSHAILRWQQERVPNGTTLFLASRPTMPSSKRSMVGSGLNA